MQRLLCLLLLSLFSSQAIAVPARPSGPRATAERAIGAPHVRPVPVADPRLPRQVRVLDRIDLTRVIQEDAKISEEKGGRRIGVLRKLAPMRVDAGSQNYWSMLSDGRQITTIELEAPGSEGIRIHLEDVQLPTGSRVVVYASDDPADAYGPHEVTAGELWIETVFSPKVCVEIVIPAGASTRDVQAQIREIAHIYTPWKALVQPRVGSCHNDVMCTPAWTTAAAGVAGIGSISRDGYIFCTGCLLADSDPAAQLNYFMTANHCVTTPTSANTLEFYWFYQSEGCGGIVPALNSVPRTTGGADFLTGISRSRGTDFSFLRMRNPPPPGVIYEAWSAATPANGSSIASIHHPDGDYKRISFGSLMGPATRDSFWSVQWSSGVTEPGSSGGPLFNENKEFLGQLYGGTSYCAFPNGLDEFGRFDRTFPFVQAWLRPVSPQLLFFEDPRDFDGDGESDRVVHHAPEAKWYLNRSSQGFTTTVYGYPGVVPCPGDYDGDGRTDLCVYHPPSGTWYIQQSTAGFRQVQFGYVGTLPVAADYDGDGRTDIGVFDPANGVWSIFRSTAGFTTTQFGYPGVVPVACDFDGDNRADIAVFAPDTGIWHVFRSTLGYQATQFGYSTVIPVPADYDADGRRDFAVFDPDQARWYISASTAGFSTFVFGAPGGIPLPLDYDGDGRADPATYYATSGSWSIRESAGSDQLFNFGWFEAFPPGLKP